MLLSKALKFCLQEGDAIMLPEILDINQVKHNDESKLNDSYVTAQCVKSIMRNQMSRGKQPNTSFTIRQVSSNKTTPARKPSRIEDMNKDYQSTQSYKYNNPYVIKTDRRTISLSQRVRTKVQVDQCIYRIGYNQRHRQIKLNVNFEKWHLEDQF